MAKQKENTNTRLEARGFGDWNAGTYMFCVHCIWYYRHQTKFNFSNKTQIYTMFTKQFKNNLILRKQNKTIAIVNIF